MTLFDVLRHFWQQQLRSPRWGLNLLSALLLVAASGFVGLSIVGLCWAYPQIVADVAPGKNPFQLLNRHIGIGIVGLTAARFFGQRSGMHNVQVYRALPVPIGKIACLLQVRSALSLFNLLPLVAAGVLGASTVVPEVTAGKATVWGIGVLAALVISESANVLLRVAWNRDALPVVGMLVLGASALILSDAAGLGGIRDVSDWLFGGAGVLRVFPLLILCGAAVGTTAGAHRVLQSHIYTVVVNSTTNAPGGDNLSLSWRPQGRVLSLALVSAKLIFRNKRPRQAMLNTLLMTVLFGFQLSMFTFEDGTFSILFVSFVIVTLSIALTGLAGHTYGGFCYAWHGAHFDGVLVRTGQFRTLVRSQYVVMCGLYCVQTAVILLAVQVLPPAMLAPLLTFALYNAGVVAPLALGLGVWGRQAVALDQSALLNYQGNTTITFIGGALVQLVGIVLPVGLWVTLGRGAALWSVGLLGGLGLVLSPLWTFGIGAMLRRKRYALAAGFRDE